MSRANKTLAFSLMLILMVPALAAAAEFSAQMMLKDSGRMMPGKLYIKNGKMRQEFVDAEGQTITIVRQDKKLVWVVLPEQKAYVELPLRTNLPGQFLQVPPDAISKRRVGQETVNGYLADRYEVTVRGGAAGVQKQTFWVAPKLGIPVKMVCSERNFCLEYRSIKEGPVAERLFNVPPGYRKLSSLPGIRLSED
jgi:outer membrane lipoprotein-sorting protein